MNEKVTTFTTLDNRIAGFLSHLNFIHLRTEPAINRRRGFAFTFADESHDARTVADSLFTGAGTTDCLALLDAYRAVSATIHYAREHGLWENKEL